ncbi:MAG: hypothetical protein WC758_02895 [Candidatus Woesearchaeota archaeon]|jgi:hypothetical protein
MNLEDVINFLDEIKKIRLYDLEIVKSSSSLDVKNEGVEFIKNELFRLSQKYAGLLDVAEKAYLSKLSKEYGGVDTSLNVLSIEKLAVLDSHIDELDITIGANMFLKTNKILYFGELIHLSKQDLFKMPTAKPKIFAELNQLITREGYTFGSKINYVNPIVRKNI